MNGDAAAAWAEEPKTRPVAASVLGVLGVAAFAVALWSGTPYQFNVVTYATVPFESSAGAFSTIFALLVLAGIVVLASRGGGFLTATARLAPLSLSLPMACFVALGSAPPFALSFLMILGGGWAAHRAVESVGASTPWRLSHPAALGSIVVLIALLTLVHTRLQINFFEHFMLGHADMGHFTEELKNALVGRGLRSDSFENTRLGWHFVPLMYVLVPGYALWPSPVYLMACGAVAVHVVALPAYFLARRLSGSTTIGWMWGVTWLLLPPVSRLVYCNTYGFQWNNVTMPLVAGLVAMGLTGRWRTSLVFVVLLLLSRETAAAAVFGWGIYVALFTPRRATGIIVVAVSLLYVVLCTQWLIPHFAASGRYDRLDLFGELGASAGELLRSCVTHPLLLIERLARAEVLYLLLMLLVPMAFLPLRGWRLAIAALPTLAPVLLLKNDDWLSIKFWHHATVVALLFFAGLSTLAKRRKVEKSKSQNLDVSAFRRFDVSRAAAVLVCAALSHYFYGFSPIAKAYGPYLAAATLHEPDPRLETVRRLRSELPRDRTILATERIAAHFTDYHRLYTGGRARTAYAAADYVIIDESDHWDTSGLPGSVPNFMNDAHYKLHGRFGSVVVFAHR